MICASVWALLLIRFSFLSSDYRTMSVRITGGRSKANGPAVIQSLQHEITGFVEVNPEGGKVSRAAAASPQLESGNWYLPHPMLASWVEEFVGECAALPAGAYDDQVDAWSQGAKRLLDSQSSVSRPTPRQYFREFSPSGDSWMLY